MNEEHTALVARVEGWKLGHLPPDTVIEEVVAQLAAVIRALAGEVNHRTRQLADFVRANAELADRLLVADAARDTLRAELEAEKAAHWRTCQTAAHEAEERDRLAGEVEEQEREAEEQQDSLRQAWAERDTLRAEVAALEKQVRLAAGMLSTTGRFADQHPEVALRYIQDSQAIDDAALAEKQP